MIAITRFLIFLANLYILTYIYLLKINSCNCSDDWRRDFIFNYSLAYIFIVISFMVFPEIFYQNIQFAILLKILMALLLLVNIYCLYTYSQKLEKENCLCSDSIARDFMKIFGIFYAVIMVLVFSYLIIYYVNKEYKHVIKNKRILSNNNLNKILIVTKT